MAIFIDDEPRVKGAEIKPETKRGFSRDNLTFERDEIAIGALILMIFAALILLAAIVAGFGV